MSNWTNRFLSMSRLVASWSRDPSTKVGAVIVREDNTVASLGFNGFPRGVSDRPELYRDRDSKLARTVHAELNAILSSHERLDGFRIYTTHPPCSGCAAAIIQSGIKKVVTQKPDQDLLSRWKESIDRAYGLLREAGVQVVEV